MAERQYISYKFRDWQNFRHIEISVKDEEAGMLLTDLKEAIIEDRNFNKPKFKVTDYETSREYEDNDKIAARTKVVVELVFEEGFMEIDESVTLPSLGKEDNSRAVSVSSRESSVSSSSRRSSKSGVSTSTGVSVTTALPTLGQDQNACRPLTREEEEKRITDFVENAAEEYEQQVAYHINQQQDCRICKCYSLRRDDPGKHRIKDCRIGLHPGYVCKLCLKREDHVIQNCHKPINQAVKCNKCNRGTHVVYACPFT